MELVPATPPTKAPRERFTGEVHSTTLSTPSAPAYLAAGIVQFAPGARTNWHVHENGQVLHVLDGTAIVGTRDGQVVSAEAGSTITCMPGEEHWHGAGPDVPMSHLAIVVASPDSAGTEWRNPVDAATYVAAVARV